jgi:hypothetical protein
VGGTLTQRRLGDNGTLTLWDYDTGTPFQNMDDVPQPGSLEAEAGVFCSTFDATGTRLITGGADKTIKVCLFLRVAPFVRLIRARASHRRSMRNNRSSRDPMVRGRGCGVCIIFVHVPSATRFRATGPLGTRTIPRVDRSYTGQTKQRVVCDTLFRACAYTM